VDLHYDNITSAEQLAPFCRDIASVPSIAIDTEFVSESSYRPELCLVQVCAGERLAVIDPLGIPDMRPFWETLVEGDHITIVHAGRSEMEFCLQSVERLPKKLFDVQIAAGLVGIEFPAGYSTLVSRLLAVASSKHETRTDWRRRPLSKRQVDYAVEDVYHLPRLYDRLVERLGELGRLAWIEEDMRTWQEDLQRSLSTERWRRVAGNSGLDQRSLAIVHELWKWREGEAKRRNQPARHVLRDDLIVELAKRQSADAKRIGAVRGMERGDLARRMPELAACIERALTMPEEACPPRVPREATPQLSVLGQFLFAALGSVCRHANIAPNLVGGPGDIRDWIAYRMAPADKPRREPQLAKGWRAEFVGALFDDLLSGNTVLRIGDPLSEHPLVLEKRGATGEL
jgi:ribonuclease D